MPLSSLLRSSAFQAASGGTLCALRNAPGEALMWRQELAPYAALREVSVEAGDSWLSVHGEAMGKDWLGRFQSVRIAARSISIWHTTAPPPPPVDGEEAAWALPRFLAALEPILQESNIRYLELECHYALIASPASAAPEMHVLLSRNVQQPTLGIVLSVPARPARWAATHGRLSATFTRPAPGNDDAVLVCVQRHV